MPSTALQVVVDEASREYMREIAGLSPADAYCMLDAAAGGGVSRGGKLARNAARATGLEHAPTKAAPAAGTPGAKTQGTGKP